MQSDSGGDKVGECIAVRAPHPRRHYPNCRGAELHQSRDVQGIDDNLLGVRARCWSGLFEFLNLLVEERNLGFNAQKLFAEHSPVFFV